MKRFTSWILAGALAVLVGCAGTDRAQRCERYSAVYETYLRTTAIRPVSKEESAAATAAALFLSTYCGWSKTRGEDPNGVPVILPPAR